MNADQPRETGRETAANGADSRKRYCVSTLDKALTIVELLAQGQRPLSIQEIARMTGFQRVAVFRLLSTLEQRGYVQRLANKKYYAVWQRRRLLLGYCAPLTGNSFRMDLAAGLRRAAAEAGTQLLLIDNSEEDADLCLRNAQLLIDARADMAIMFEPLAQIAHIVADQFFRAGIPLISVEIPVQGAVYFGANNYHAGKLAGQVLGKFASENWGAKFDRVVLVESSWAGANVQARLSGVLYGLRDRLGAVVDSQVIHLDGQSHVEASREVVSQLLSQLRVGTRLLISGFNDQSAIGALQAARGFGREQDVAIVGQNASDEGRREIRNPDSRLIASIAYFPERYGESLVRVAQSILHRESVPPAVYTEHVVLDRHNVDTYYGRSTETGQNPKW